MAISTIKVGWSAGKFVGCLLAGWLLVDELLVAWLVVCMLAGLLGYVVAWLLYLLWLDGLAGLQDVRATITSAAPRGKKTPGQKLNSDHVDQNAAILLALLE